MFALIDNLGFGEFTIVAIAALLVFGKRLPQVAGQAGAQIAKLRRSLDTAWRESGVAKEIRSVQREFQEAAPRDLSIGEMARMASADIQKNLRDVEAESTTVPRSLPGASANRSSEASAPTSPSAPSSESPTRGAEDPREAR
jgi:Sec-independent protein translocase protein TatA